MRSSRRSVLAAALAAAVASGPLAVPARALEPLLIGTSSLKGASLRLYGFVQTDSIYDTTQSFTEESYNSLVQTRTTAAGKPNYAGQRGREQLSVRNSRFGAEFSVPASDGGISAKGVFEMDLLGNNGPNAVPGAAPGAQSESDFYDNPAVRVRHAFVDVTRGELDAKIGQTWSLLGWQPFYLTGEAVVPAAGQLYRRFPQVRVTDTRAFGDWTLETAADAAKPAEMNSGSPEWHAGARAASTKLMGASICGPGTAMVGLSAGVSAALIPVRTQSIGSPTGSAIAVDVLVPIIPSSGGKDRSNTLIWAAEGLVGSGVGGLEYAGLTFGVPGVGAATPNSGTAIDAGIAGLDTTGNVQLIRVRAFRSHLQYSWTKWSASAGYAQVEGRNLDRFAAGAAALTIAPKLQFAYVSGFYDAAAWLRFGAEINRTRDTYNDPGNRWAVNDRYQLAAYFIF